MVLIQMDLGEASRLRLQRMSNDAPRVQAMAHVVDPFEQLVDVARMTYEIAS